MTGPAAGGSESPDFRFSDRPDDPSSFDAAGEGDDDDDKADPYLLYGGESLVDEASVDTARIAVTTHRVVALTPNGPGARYQTVDRPNVTGVAVQSQGDLEDAVRAIRFGIYSAVLLGAGALIDLDGMIQPVDVPEGTGLGGVIGTVTMITQAFALIDDLLLAAGLVVLPIALFFCARYLRGRERNLEVGVAGDDPLRVPAPDAGAAEAAATRIEAALETASNAPGR